MPDNENIKNAMYRERMELFARYLDEKMEELGSYGIIRDSKISYDEDYPIRDIPIIREYILITNTREVFYNLFHDLMPKEEEEKESESEDEQKDL